MSLPMLKALRATDRADAGWNDGSNECQAPVLG